MKTFAEFAEANIVYVLCKERAKYCRRNRSQRDFSLPEGDVDSMSARKFLSTVMPPRARWQHPKPKTRRRFLQPDGKLNLRRMNRYMLERTVARDRERQREGERFAYLDRLDAYTESVLDRIRTGQVVFDRPQLQPLFKSAKQTADGGRQLTFRPLSVYTRLDDKVILSLASMYLARLCEPVLHTHILSYRPPRRWGDEKAHVTDFNDGIRCIAAFREQHADDAIYVADCDIKKFYDSLYHPMVMNCVGETLDRRRNLSDEAKWQIMQVVKAYLASYNFHDDVLVPSQREGYWTPFCKAYRPRPTDRCEYAWMSPTDLQRLYGADLEREIYCIGVPQGGALSLNIANIVLNHVDRQAGLAEPDERKLFLRFCDDMILLHTSASECERLMEAYCRALTDHRLVFHPMESVERFKPADQPEKTRRGFWDQKSHLPFLWGRGLGNSNAYIGFLGYEMRRDGQIRFRKSNERKWTDKWWNFYYAVCRQTVIREKNERPLTDEQLAELEKNVALWLRTLEQSRRFYTGFDWADPDQYDVRQWTHIHQREKYMLSKLRGRLRWHDKRRYARLIDLLRSGYPPLNPKH